MRVGQLVTGMVAGALLCGVALSQQSSQSNSNSSSQNGSAQAHGSSSASASSSSSKSGFATGSQSAQGNGSGSGTSLRIPKPTHAIFYIPTSNWSESSYDAIRANRLQYFAKLQQAGKLIYFGPWRDTPGEMSILVGTDDEMKQIATNDPAVTSGQMTTEVRPWTVEIEPYSGVATQRRSGGK